MNGKENLIPIKDSEIARQLQEKSVQKRRENTKERKLIKQGLEEKMGMCFDDYINAIFDKALAGDTKAWELIRDTMGEKPVDKVETTNIPVVISGCDELAE